MGKVSNVVTFRGQPMIKQHIWTDRNTEDKGLVISHRTEIG